jgi:hypothetical protein
MDPDLIGCGGCKAAIPGLEPGIPARVTAEWVLPRVGNFTHHFPFTIRSII